MVVKKPESKYETVLLLDDSEIDNFINLKIVEGCNFSERVYMFTNAKGAIEFLKNLERDKSLNPVLVPQLIFVDLNMPIMDGFQFIEEYEKLSEKVKRQGALIILTSSDNPRDNESAPFMKNKYIRKFISKPLTIKHLTQMF